MNHRSIGLAVAAFMSLGVAACGHHEKTVVVPPANTATTPATIPPTTGTSRICPGAATC